MTKIEREMLAAVAVSDSSDVPGTLGDQLSALGRLKMDGLIRLKRSRLEKTLGLPGKLVLTTRGHLALAAQDGGEG